MGNSVFEWGQWRFEQEEWRLTHAHTPVQIYPKALQLLAVLLERSPGLVTKEEFLERLWPDAFVEEGNIAFYVTTLRKTLDTEAGPSCIETVRTKGYRFVTPVTTGLPPATSSEPMVESGSPGDPALPQFPPLASQPGPRTHRAWMAAGAPALVLLAVAALIWAFTPRPPPEISRLAVMPFRVLDTASNSAVLAGALPDAITTLLASLPFEEVLPTSTSGDEEDPVTVGARLGVDAVMTGTLTRRDNQIEATAQLFRVRDRARLWSRSFRVDDADMTVARQQLAEQIATHVFRRLDPQQRRRLNDRDTPSAKAYDLFLRARELWTRRTPEAVQEAIRVFEEVLTLDPEFARAHAGLANCYNLTSSGLDATLRYPLAKQHAETAVALAPDSSEAHTSLAVLRYKFEWQWEAAETEFRRAIALDRTNALARHWFGEFLARTGRPQEAVAQYAQGLQLDPRSLAMRSDYVPALLAVGRTDEARQMVESALEIDPNWFYLPARMAEVLRAEGRQDEAMPHDWRSSLLRGFPIEDVDARREAYLLGGDTTSTEIEIAQYLAHDEAPSGPYFAVATNLSLLYGSLCQKPEALDWLETALARKEDVPLYILSTPDYDCLHNEPRFQAIVNQVGLRDAFDARHPAGGDATP